MTLEKSSWDAFEAHLKIGVQYHGSVWNKPLNVVTEIVEELPETNYKPDRMYKSSTQREYILKRQDGSTTRLYKLGKVYRYMDFLLIERKFDDELIGDATCVVIYRINPNKL